MTIKIKAKKVDFDGKTFMAYKTQIGNLNLDVKLTKESKYNDTFNKLKDGEIVEIELNENNVNLNTMSKYPVLWVK